MDLKSPSVYFDVESGESGPPSGCPQKTIFCFSNEGTAVANPSKYAIFALKSSSLALFIRSAILPVPRPVILNVAPGKILVGHKNLRHYKPILVGKYTGTQAEDFAKDF